jgi:hypothetical protein
MMENSVFRFENVFDLINDFLPLTKSDDFVPIPDEQKENVKVIGEEKGLFIISWNGHISQSNKTLTTFIDIFDLKSKTRKNVYSHQTQINVVNASINYHHSLLALTLCSTTLEGKSK